MSDCRSPAGSGHLIASDTVPINARIPLLAPPDRRRRTLDARSTVVRPLSTLVTRRDQQRTEAVRMGRLLGPRLAPAARVPLERSQPVPGLAEPSVTPDHRCCRLKPRAMPPSRCSRLPGPGRAPPLPPLPCRLPAAQRTVRHRRCPRRGGSQGVIQTGGARAVLLGAEQLSCGHLAVLAVVSPREGAGDHHHCARRTGGKLSQAQRDGQR